MRANTNPPSENIASQGGTGTAMTESGVVELFRRTGDRNSRPSGEYMSMASGTSIMPSRAVGHRFEFESVSGGVMTMNDDFNR